MNTSQKGFSTLLVIIILGVLSFGALAVLEAEDGTTYLDKIMDSISDKQAEIEDAVEGYKETAEKRNNEILEVETEMQVGR